MHRAHSHRLVYLAFAFLAVLVSTSLNTTSIHAQDAVELAASSTLYTGAHLQPQSSLEPHQLEAQVPALDLEANSNTQAAMPEIALIVEPTPAILTDVTTAIPSISSADTPFYAFRNDNCLPSEFRGECIVYQVSPRQVQVEFTLGLRYRLTFDDNMKCNAIGDVSYCSLLGSVSVEKDFIRVIAEGYLDGNSRYYALAMSDCTDVDSTCRTFLVPRQVAEIPIAYGRPYLLLFEKVSNCFEDKSTHYCYATGDVKVVDPWGNH